MQYQNMNTKKIESYEYLKAILYKDKSIAKDGTEIIVDYHLIEKTTKPIYDPMTQRVVAGGVVDYKEVWVVEDIPQDEIDKNDIGYRNSYKDKMEKEMIAIQKEALGDPEYYRFIQAIQRYSVTDISIDPDDILFREGYEEALKYQEDNGKKFSDTIEAISQLSGKDIIDYPMPDFAPETKQTKRLYPYLIYLQNGYL